MRMLNQLIRFVRVCRWLFVKTRRWWLVLGSCAAARWLWTHWRNVASEVLWKLCIRNNLRSEHFRREFNDTPMVRNKPDKHHTHGEAASDRSSAVQFLEHISARLGMRYYSFQKSAADVRRGNAGSREYFWVKDVAVQPESVSTTAQDLVGLVDVDYYMDMPAYLAEAKGPVALYTFIPDNVAGHASNYAHTFNARNELVQCVAGGAEYVHPLWDYGVDHVIALRYAWWNPIFPMGAQAFLVDRRNIAENRYVVMLSPLGRWGVIGAAVTRVLSGNILRRLVVAHGDFLRLNVQRKEGLTVSTGRVGSYLAASVPVAHDETIAIMARLSKVDISIPQVQSLVEDRTVAAVLVDYHRTNAGVKPRTVYPVSEGLRSYQIVNSDYSSDVKPSLVPFMSPIVHGAFSPLNCKANDRAAVVERIQKVASSIEATPFVLRVMKEFVEFVVPELHRVHPGDVDAVYEHQDRPTQRMILDQASLWWKPERLVKMFVKKETYGNVKAPRPISTINGRDKLDYSRFIYAVADHLKTFEWYAFGKSPRRVAERVARVARFAAHVIATDFSKYDGHVSQVLRELEQMVMLRLFHPAYHAEILDLCRSQYGMPGVTAHGVRYFVEYARCSGSPETSAFNTLGNAFVNFLAFRLTRVEGRFLSAEEAWARLGLYGGDDGLTADVDSKQIVRAAAMIGQEIVAESVRRGQFGVKFLARYYSPEVWTGALDSVADISRQLSKLHVTVHLAANITPAMKLVEKARSYVTSDMSTPILGEFCVKVMQFAHRDPELLGRVAEANQALAQLRYWHAVESAEDQYPNERTDWARVLVERDLPTFDWTKFWEGLEEAKTMDDLLSFPLCAEPIAAESKLPVDVDGMLVAVPSMRVAMKPPPLDKRRDRSANWRGKPRGAGRARGRSSRAGHNTTTWRQYWMAWHPVEFRFMCILCFIDAKRKIREWEKFERAMLRDELRVAGANNASACPLRKRKNGSITSRGPRKRLRMPWAPGACSTQQLTGPCPPSASSPVCLLAPRRGLEPPWETWLPGNWSMHQLRSAL